jgi:hypothetical protein
MLVAVNTGLSLAEAKGTEISSDCQGRSADRNTPQWLESRSRP